MSYKCRPCKAIEEACDGNCVVSQCLKHLTQSKRPQDVSPTIEAPRAAKIVSQTLPKSRASTFKDDLRTTSIVAAF